MAHTAMNTIETNYIKNETFSFYFSWLPVVSEDFKNMNHRLRRHLSKSRALHT